MPKTGLYLATAGGFAIGLIASRYLNKSTARLRNGAESSKKFLPILAENRPRTYYAWRGPSMIVLDAQGEAGSLEDSGFFFRQTRYLRELRLELFGESPHFCSTRTPEGSTSNEQTRFARQLLPTTATLSSAARRPLASFWASSLAQKWTKIRRGCSVSI